MKGQVEIGREAIDYADDRPLSRTGLKALLLNVSKFYL